MKTGEVASPVKYNAREVEDLIGATTFTGVFLTQGGGKAIVDAILGLGLGKWGTYWMMQIIYIILGCFIDWIGIIIPAITASRIRPCQKPSRHQGVL